MCHVFRKLNVSPHQCLQHSTPKLLVQDRNRRPLCTLTCCNPPPPTRREPVPALLPVLNTSMSPNWQLLCQGNFHTHTVECIIFSLQNGSFASFRICSIRHKVALQHERKVAHAFAIPLRSHQANYQRLQILIWGFWVFNPYLRMFLLILERGKGEGGDKETDQLSPVHALT